MDSAGEPDWSAVWAQSGAASLSGRSGGPALDVPHALVRLATESAAAIAESSGALGRRIEINGPALLGERAALMGLGRAGATSCGGATRVMPTADDWIVVCLARNSDIDSVPAWLGATVGTNDELWPSVLSLVARRLTHDLVERGVLLGMPVARLGEVERPGSLVRASPLGTSPNANSRVTLADAVVVDLSALWAGPLCAHLLGLAGARVIKVESVDRPDGARFGNGEFFDLLHGGHESVCVDFRDNRDIDALRSLLQCADVVIESSRPRALEQLGIVPSDMSHLSVWLSITGYGRDRASAQRVGFGDDAAVAGGLATSDESGPCFCADAVADPLTGMVAAAAVLSVLREGNRALLDVALARTAAWAAHGPLTDIRGRALDVPRCRRRGPGAAPIGRDTEAVFSEFEVGRRG